MNNFHCPAAKDIRWSDHQWIADLLGPLQRLILSCCRPILWLQQPESGDQFLEMLPVFGLMNRLWRGAQDRHTRLRKTAGQFQRGLPAVLNNQSCGIFHPANFENILECQRLKVQSVRGIVVG